MKRVNKVGPELIRNLPAVRTVPPADLAKTTRAQLVLDVRNSASFAQGHVPGSINVPSSSLVQWAGFFVDYNKPLYLLTDSESIAVNCEVFARLESIMFKVTLISKQPM